MTAIAELVGLARRRDGVLALSAYVPVDAHAPPAAARTVLRGELARLRDERALASHAERTQFDACAERLLERVETGVRPLTGGTWFGVAFADGTTYERWVDRVLPLTVVWEGRARVAPLLAASDRRPVVVAAVDRAHAAVFVCENGGLAEVERWTTTTEGEAGAHMSAPPRRGFHRGTAGPPAADELARQREDAAGRHITRAARALRALDTPGAWIVIGGAAEAVAALRTALGAHFGGRIGVMSDAVRPDGAPHELRAPVERALGRLRAAHEQALVDSALDHADGAHVVLGTAAVDAALTEAAVRTLVVARSALSRDSAAVEDLVRRAMDQGAAVEFVGGGAATRLAPRAADGVLAVLRYAGAGARQAAEVGTLK